MNEPERKPSDLDAAELEYLVERVQHILFSDFNSEWDIPTQMNVHHTRELVKELTDAGLAPTK